MSGIARLSAELKKLDELVRHGNLTRAEYRSRRRSMILSLEQGGNALLGAGDETIENARPEVLAPQAAAPSAAKAGGASKGLLIGGAVVVVAAIGAAIVLTSAKKPDAAPVPAMAAAAPAPAGASSQGDLPQTLAARLMKTEWTAADIEDFLTRWDQLPAEARRAAADDAGLWLLRGETERRLREAGDAQAVDPTSETQARMEQLARVQTAIRVD